MWDERNRAVRVQGCALVVLAIAVVVLVGGWLGLIVGGLLKVAAL
jgi:hypothetical protein